MTPKTSPKEIYTPFSLLALALVVFGGIVGYGLVHEKEPASRLLPYDTYNFRYYAPGCTTYDDPYAIGLYPYRDSVNL